ncbi:FctA domain-containing protein [Collinsella sp. CLA-ER-H4]|uniref:Spy0128 family protein n=1 Tax=Collinsella sp. CLA-ER-H4 TaxID=3136227 RepID=UPI0032BF2239
MLKPFGKKTNTAKRVLRVLAVPLAACALMLGASSASADQSVPLSNHTVETVNPTGTTVNLFDYWVVNGDNDKSVNINNNNGNNNTGINKNHQLKFNGGAGTGINKWTGRSNINGFGRLSFVKTMLVDGYPAISNGTHTSQGQGVNYTDESLAYLFNNDSQANGKQDGKAVYNDVKGLFQLKDGYYVYDSYGSDGNYGNYAVYNPTTNSFNVYDKAGVYKGDVSDANLGQFFPFDSADKVFDEKGNSLSPKQIIDGSTSLNHHFGMSMTTEFVQPAGGKTTDNNDMVFEFSGDDDVWVYIDGVLVGDLGGIHEKATLDINFATGEVKVGHIDGANGAEKEIEKTNIKAKFKAAGADTSNFSGNTFRDSSKHTLSFFYLERGAGASNMKLKFNLTTLPSSEVAKVDQNGEAVQGAEFALYQSDANWNAQDEAIAQGTTDANGQLVLLKPDRSVLSFDNQHAEGHDYFVLKEVGLPAGYRSSLTSSTTATPGELHLQYKKAASGTGGVVVAPQTTVTTADGKSWTGSRMWLNGGYLAAKETISLNKETKDNKGNAISSGTTFAVVLKLTGASEDHTSEDAWTAVTGNPLNGYKLCSAHGIAGAVEAAKSADTSVFDVNTKGDYVVTVRSLPGDIEKYAAMLEDKSQSEYTVAVYHTTASSLAGATIDNTSMVQYQTINRQFSTVIHLTNVQNRLFVQKVDDLDEPVDGATFELYKSDDVAGDSPSTYAINPGATPYDTVKAKGMTYPYDIKGAACFPLDSTEHKPLTKGTYYLRESVSPDGHEINNTITKVIVDDSGVYVDAGKEGDGVRSMSGPGSLIASLAQFGSPDSIDNTLTHIKGKLQSAAVDANGNLTWGQTCTAQGVTPSLAGNWMHMRYDKTTQGAKAILRYVEDGGERDGQLATIFADTGINRMALYQDDDATNGTDLGTLQLNHLFTTATAVQYTDRRVARLQVTKTVTADAGLTAPTKDADDNDLPFTFKFTLPESQEGYEAHVFDASGNAVGNSFRLKNGGTHSIKAGETIRVYDLKKGDSYSVSELTTKGEESSGNVLASIVNTVTGSADESVLPAGFSLVRRMVGGEKQSGTGNTITGSIAALVDGKIPASNTLEFINKYSVSPVKNGLSAKKMLEGRDWADGDSFTVQLTADDGVPMPNGAKSKVSTVELTKNSQTQTVGDITYKTATFGDITYTKPGTYTYTISEVIPGSDAGADGISYSAARYKAEVVVEDNQAGALVVESVKMTQERNDAGDDTKTEVADAIFTNRYDEHEGNITIHAQKSLTDNAGSFPLSQNAFSFELKRVGGYADDNAAFDPDKVDKSIKAPMPQDAEGDTATVGNNADGTVTWPAISYTAKADAGRAYVYKFAENLGSIKKGMDYDKSVYYAVVRNAEKGAGIQTSIEYYKVAEDGSVKQLDKNATPSFTNIYSVEPTSATLQGQKTVSGRDWNQGERYTFNLTAATDDASATGLGKTTAKAVTDGAVAIGTNQAVASAPASGRVASFAFGAEAAPTVTFNRAGTFSFNITEDAARDGQAGMSMDKHTARATVVVADLDESGNHTGKLRVSSVTYANTGASDADKAVTDKAAFTNAYHASGTFGGVTVSKTLEGRASVAGQFTFTATGLWHNGVQTSVDGSEASLSNTAAGAGVPGTVVSASGAEKLFARELTEQDLGRTFAYRIHENQPAAAGYTYDIGYTGDVIVLVKVLAHKDDPAKLYTVTTVLKGAGVTELLGDGADASTLTDEKIVQLKQDSHTYVQQYDASEAGATTPAVSFVNRYEASLDYGAAGGLQIEKTLTYPKDATVFGSPKITFRYIVKPADETSASKVGISTNGKVFETANVEADAPKTVSLIPAGGLTFTQDDAGKTFTYTVSEIDDKATDYTYDKTVHAVKAVVADNGDGTLRVTTAVSKQVDGKDELEGQWIYPSGATSTGVATVKFKNTYTVTEAATYTPSVTKVVAGADAPGKFTFAMTAADDATKTAIDGKLITGSSMSVDNGYAEEKQTTAALKDGEHEKIDFSKLTFNKPGTYTFTINELAPNGGLGEWTYDAHTYALTVTVTDEGGKLVARADGTTGSEGFIFTNRYRTSTSYELQGGLELVKTLSGHDLHAGMFGFTVTGEDPASTDKLNKLLRADKGKLTVTNDEPQTDGTSHTGILGGLTFATEDADKTFTYKVVENRGNKGGYQYDSTYWMVEIAVKKRGDGSLYTVTTVKHYDANEVEEPRDTKTFSSENGVAKAQVFFTNSYAATGTFDGLTAEKVMDSGDKIEAGQYTFDLYAEKADGSLEKMDEGTTQAAKNGTATVDFGKVNFKLGDATSGTHEQTIDLAGAVNDGVATKRHNADHTTTYSFNLVAKERLANLPEGVRPVDTSATCRVLLEVTDNNDGTLTPRVTYRDGTENGKIVFHNTRDKVKTIGTVAKPDVDIDGQLLSVGDSYVYTINWVNTEADDNGNPLSVNATVTDELPTGVVFEAFEGEYADKGSASGQLLTWNLGEQPAGSHGSVRVRVKITEDAVKDAQSAIGTIKNTATVTVGNKSYTGTTTNYAPKKSESDARGSTGSGVALGDELTYTIGYKNTEGASATVTITDAVPAGTEFVEFAGDHKDAGSKDNDGNLTWKLTDVPAGKEGTVQFKVRVTEDAFKSGGASGNIFNQASVAVGDKPAVKTNTTTDQVSDGRLTLSKTVTAAEGIVAPNKAFTFKVLLCQADGATPLTGTFAYAGRPSGTNGTYVSGQIKSGDTIALKAGGSVTVTVPVGARYEVQELDSKGDLMTSEDGFAIADKANTKKGTVGQTTQAGFTNVYSVESTKVENAFKVQKKISGRNWITSDAFTMTLTAQGEAPMPKGAKEGVSTIELHKDAQVGNFGAIEYTKPGTYTYMITEQSGDEAALTFSKATYRATVTVTDNGAGKLSAKTKIAQLTDDAGDAAERTVEAAVFTNTAKTGSLTVKKTVVGGDSQREFGFAVTLTDGDGEPVSGTFGKGEHAVTFTDGKMTFTLKDGGEKTIAGLPVGAHYTVTEDAAEGYTTTVNGADGSKAEGAVTEDGATVAFTNTVKTGELDVSKTVVAREGLAVDVDKTFEFAVEATDAAGRGVSGTYGDATFEDGKATLKLKGGQKARITGLPAGTAYTVTEHAAAGYKAAVNGAEGFRAEGSITANQVSSAAFTNTFDPAPATASVPELTKVLAGGRKPGLQEGEFAFELSLADGADNVLEGYPIEAKNDKDGKVSFGELSFTNPGTYHATVTEKASGDVLIEDDAHAYTFDVTVTQTGAGLKAEISNERGKKTFTNTFTPHDNTKTVTKADASGAKVDVDGKLVGVGDTLTYTIGWANNSVDDKGAAQAADVTVTDVLPKGVDYVEGTAAENATYDAATRTLTWSLGEQAAGATGTLGFDVKVSAEAAVVDDIANTATVKVGENESQTNTTHNSVPREGSLTVKKTVVGGDSQREFGFAVTLADGDGEPVSGTFGKDAHAVTFTDGKATFTLKDGEEKTIAGLPVGARYTVTEDAAEGYTTAVNGADGSKAEGAVTEDGATVAFTNTYGTAAEGRDVSTAGLFTKTLEGRDWAEGDSFQFALTGEGGAPMPEGSADGSKTVSVTAAAGTKAGDRVAFDFGPIRYTLDDIKDAGFAEVGGKRVRAKTFTYTVREVRHDDGSAIAGVAYDGHTATMTVTVTDDGSGNLTATTPAIAQASGGDFVNTYTTELDYSARAGVRLSKTLSGRAMEAGQFAFTVTADAETAAKLGLKTDKDAYAVAAADDGEADLIDLVGGAAGSDVKFTDADAGKTYSFTVTETKLGGEGYANDTAPRTVTIAPAYDAATGKLTVTTTVAKDGVEVARSEVSTADDVTATPAPVTVAFENSYEATGALGGEGNVAINATKTLTGRAAAAGEFSFSVRDARGNVVATATNWASGDGEAAGLAFSPISYTTDALGRMVAEGTATRAADGSWVIPYTVSEDGTDRLPAGVTATASSFDITVKVTDNGKGGLDVAVTYPEGSDGTLSFVNGYGTNEATVDLAGTKTLAFGQAGLGLTQADIAGKYTFKIEPLDGAPAPVDASGKTVTEATNDAAGNVVLGRVTFKQPSDLDDVEIDGDGLRTKTFAYRVSESGSVDGVVNDATAIRTFAVKVVEDTNAGTLAAEVLPAEGTPEGKGAFEFTNTYGVNPTPSSVTDQITVNKKLKGCDLAEGEFEFQLVEIAADGSESVAATGKNAADGTVALSPVAYTAPGTHSYELREVAGTAGGVTYDRATYRVRTTVADAGNGKLTVRHELADAEGNPTGGDSVTFTNGYEAAPVTLKLGAAKVLKGAELKAGQFSFELKSRDGKVMSIAKNAADGSVTFDALTFKLTGTYTFTVSEVDDGQAHVTYDKAVHKIVVTVSDKAADGTKTGYLSAKVSYEGDANIPPVFTNSYAENPGTPGTPENPGTPGGGSDGGSDNGSGSGSSGDGSKGGMPDTGDRSLPVEALAAMAGIGALTAVGGAVLYRRRR